MINEIEYGAHCFGSYLIIDGENVDNYEQNDQNRLDHILQLKLKLVVELEKNLHRLSVRDLTTISEIITQNNPDWEFDEENSRSNSCDQCGNYNYNEIYRKIN